MRKRVSLSSEDGLSRQDWGHCAPERPRRPLALTRTSRLGWFASPHSHLSDSGAVCRHAVTRPQIGDKGGLWRVGDARAALDASTEPARGAHSPLTVVPALRPERTGCGAEWAWQEQPGLKRRSCAMASAQVAKSSRYWPWRGPAGMPRSSSSTSGLAGRWAITCYDVGAVEGIGSFVPPMPCSRLSGATAISARSWCPGPGIRHWRDSAVSQRKTAATDRLTTKALPRWSAVRRTHWPLAERAVSGPRRDHARAWRRAS
jgi:hypothetical protein